MTPFTADWARARSWRPFHEHNPVAVDRSLDGLARTLQPEKLFGVSHSGHPLAHDFRMRLGRWRLLEAGLMLSCLPNVSEYTKRLLEPKTYYQAVAELAGGVFIGNLGFTVTRYGEDGPDWVAANRRASFGAEVKCLNLSERSQAQVELMHEAWLGLASLSDAHPGTQLTIDRAALDVATRGRWVDRALVQELVLDAVIANESGQKTSALGSIVPATCSEIVGCDFGEEQIGRVRDELQKAASQLEQVLPDAGIVVLDTTLDTGLMRHCCAVSSFMNESWARELAAVVLVRPTMPGFVATFVAGPRFAELRDAEARVRVCENDHYHVDTFRQMPCIPESNARLCIGSPTFLRHKRRRRGHRQ